MNVLITGGAGFIGSHLALRLVREGYRVTVLDCLSPQIHGRDGKSPLYRSIRDRVRFIKGDVRSADAWKRALAGQEAVVHLAAETGTGQSMYRIRKYTDVNVGGTARLLDALTNGRHRVAKVVVASSRAVYGEGKYRCSEHGEVYPGTRSPADMDRGLFDPRCPRCGRPAAPVATDEASSLHPSSIYGITKLTQEQMVLEQGRSLGIPAVAFRYQNVYGPGQSLSNPYTGILSVFSSRMRAGNGIDIYEDGRESRDFVYIDDVVEATAVGLLTDRADYEALNVGTGRPVSVMKVARTLRRELDSRAALTVSGHYRLGDIRHNYADMRRARRLLGMRPATTFSRGAASFAAWVQGQAVADDRYAASVREMKRKRLYR